MKRVWQINKGKSLFFFSLFIFLFTALLVGLAFLAFSTEIFVLFALTFIIVVIAFFSIKIFIVFRIVILSQSLNGNFLGSWGLFSVHVNFDVSFLEVLDHGFELRSFDAHELDDFFLLFEVNFQVELFVGGWGSGKLYVSDLISLEVNNWLHNEDKGLLEHVEPPGLCLDVALDTRLSVSGLEVVTWMDNIDLAARLNQVHEHLEQIPVILRLQFFQVRVLIRHLGMNFCFNLHLQILLHLNHDVPINRLPLIQWFILVQLQHDCNLCLICHRQNKPLVDVLVVHIVTVRGAMQSEILLVKVYRVLAPRHCQVHVDQCSNWVSCKLPDFRLLRDWFVERLGVGFFLFIVLLIVCLFLFVLHTVLVFGFVDVEPDFTHAIVIAELFDGGFNDDVIFIYSHIFHIVEGNAEHLVVPHGKQLQLLWS